jgi:hypothetical protein
VLTLIAWMKLFRSCSWPRPVALAALGVTTANAIFASTLLLYYSLRPPDPSLPPWKDPEILNLGFLFLFAPIGAVLGFFSIKHGTPRWLTWLIEATSATLFIVGLLAAAAV